MWDQSLLGLPSSYLVYKNCTDSTLRLNYWICPHLLQKGKGKRIELGPTGRAIQNLWPILLGILYQGCETDYSPLSNVKFKNT
jgi:hypothetical protein